MRAFIIFIGLCSFWFKVQGSVSSICPNSCSSHGVCANATSVGTCQCFPSYTGIDCSLRVCPSSTAWVDIPTDSETAHADYAECSNMGSCDRSTGICKCRGGFEGAACDIMQCPVAIVQSSIPEGTNITAVCSGNGRCLSLREVSNYQTFNTYLEYNDYTGWDRDKIFGCVCQPGWGGIACENRLCPKGGDPMLPAEDINEVQLIDCLCTSCKGGLYISFRGQQTPLIPYDASEELIQFRLRQFTSIQEVQVKIVEGTSMCSAAGSVTKITFILPQGPQPRLSIIRGGGLESIIKAHDISVRAKGEYSLITHTHFSFIGGRQLVECSNRGYCDYETGICECFEGFRSSNGLGGNGSIPDCGYRYISSTEIELNNATTVTLCPVDESGQRCSGAGFCEEFTGTCQCDTGYGGPDCSLRTCTDTFAWFGNLNADHTVALDDASTAEVECSGVGTCDTSTGLCTNCGGHWGVFYGDRCELMSCPHDEQGRDCSDNGACLTLSELGLLRYDEQKLLDPVSYTASWDAHKIRGCSCFRAITVDGQYDLQYSKMISAFYYNETTNGTTLYSDEFLHKFYRGPYAFAATDFRGYACESAWCPKGDNPRTTGLNEIQQLNCQADNGSFVLTFRENTTLPIPWNVTVQDFEHHLEQLYTIGDVSVTVANVSDENMYEGRICNMDGTVLVYVEFLTEFGDLPLLQADVTLIDNIHPSLQPLTIAQIMDITEYQKGTKEDMECSGQGVCDENTGQCNCFEGFGSSNGNWDTPGERGDCTFFNKLYTAEKK